MLVEFSVANFRSFLERQTLSLVASTGSELRTTNVVLADAPKTPDLVRTAVLYGANAAGKSNVLLAMQVMWELVRNSAQLPPGGQFNVAPFAFSPEASHEPSEFELVFVQDGVRYQYGFSLTRERICDEWLFAWPEGRQQRWFERRWDPQTDKTSWHFGSSLTGQKKVWQDATRQNALFLSTAVQLNATGLLPPFNWFANRLKPVRPYARFAPDYSLRQCEADPAWQHRVAEYLAAADTGIADLRVQKHKMDTPPAPPKVDDHLPAPAIEITLRRPEQYDVHFIHRTESGDEAEIGYNDESGGTQKLFAMAAPWVDVLQNGYVLLIDELDTSLHPALLRRLVGMFHDPAINTHNAQLIFTTHDTNMLDGDLFRRDQVWFVEKGRDLQSHLYSLTDFSPRKQENIQRGYLQGRYGALPFVGELHI